MAVSGNLEDLKLKIFLFFSLKLKISRLTRFGPPNIRNVPTPLKNLIHRAPQYALSMLIAAGMGSMPWHVRCETVRRVSGSTLSLASPPSFSSTIQLQVYVLRISTFLLLRPQINF